MQPIIECVPNFSEGQRPKVIEEIAAAIRQVKGAILLHIDPGYSANRTVMTFAGEPQAVVDAAFAAIKTAAMHIDMRKHQGIHPRMGATDVCPLIPVRGINMEEVVKLAKQLGKRVGETLGIPIYLYEYAATASHRKNLASIRAGEYEGFQQKISDPLWLPDYGPHSFNPSAGQTVIGAREFLIAYNLNLNTTDREIAHDIACELRESGRLIHIDGKRKRIPGQLKGIKAIGWYVEEYKKAQISTNVTNIQLTAVHQLFEAAATAAQERGLKLTGSELIGLAPLKVFVDAGTYFLSKFHPNAGTWTESELVEAAIRYLGLHELAPFDPDERILEYRMRK